MELSHAPAEHHGKVNLPIPENLVIAWPYTDRLQSVRTTGTPVFTLTLSSYFGSPGENWLHINAVINWQLSKQGIRWQVSTGRIAGSGVDPSRSSTFLKLSGDKLLVFKWSQAQVYFCKKMIWNMLCLCHYGPAPLTIWFKTDLGRENSASYLKIQAGKTDAFYFSNHSHALVTFYVQFLCSDWSKFDRWVHVENLYSNLKLVYFDSWSWQSFERRENRGMHRNTGKLLYILGTYYGVLHEILTFLTVFFRRMYKMKYSCYQESSVIHGWFV